MVIVEAGTVHTTAAERQSHWRFLTAHLSAALFSQFELENHGRGDRSDGSFAPAVIDDPALYRALLWLNNAVSKEVLLVRRDEQVQELIYALLRHSRVPLNFLKPAMRHGRSLAIARDYLHEQFREKIALKELADLAGLSQFHFCRQFAKRYMLSPHAYQIQLRLLEAKRLLRTGRNISEVARQVGFHSASHLTRTFQRLNATSPTRFQENSKIVQARDRG